MSPRAARGVMSGPMCSRVSKCVESVAWPPVRSNAIISPELPAFAWILVVKPPPERPRFVAPPPRLLPAGGFASSQHLIADRGEPPRVIRYSPTYLIPTTFRNQAASADLLEAARAKSLDLFSPPPNSVRDYRASRDLSPTVMMRGANVRRCTLCKSPIEPRRGLPLPSRRLCTWSQQHSVRCDDGPQSKRALPFAIRTCRRDARSISHRRTR